MLFSTAVFNLIHSLYTKILNKVIFCLRLMGIRGKYLHVGFKDPVGFYGAQMRKKKMSDKFD